MIPFEQKEKCVEEIKNWIKQGQGYFQRKYSKRKQKGMGAFMRWDGRQSMKQFSTKFS